MQSCFFTTKEKRRTSRRPGSAVAEWILFRDPERGVCRSTTSRSGSLPHSTPRWINPFGLVLVGESWGGTRGAPSTDVEHGALRRTHVRRELAALVGGASC
jgi:hypothetical protein